MTRQQSIFSIWALSLGGFIPFAALTLGILLGYDPGLRLSLVTIFLFWSLAILSFLGGIRWGLAISGSTIDIRNAVLSVLPCIAGWFALLLPPEMAILCQGALYVLHAWWDSRSFRGGDLDWFRVVRFVLTALVVAAHMVLFYFLA